MNQALYKDLAKYYDLIYHYKQYAKETVMLQKLISKYKKSKGKDLLEVGCGTGEHLKYIQKLYDCTGVDINQQMINVAKKKVLNANFIRADMVHLNLKKKYDVIISLFSSIAYVKTYENLRKTINSFFHHLKEGGVLIIEPWFSKTNFRSGLTHMHTYQDDDLKIARVNVSKIKGNLSVIDMHYLISDKNKTISFTVDHHELGLFTNQKTLKIMRDAGLKSKFVKNGFMERGVFIGVR